MKIVINSIDNMYIETTSFEHLDDIDQSFKKFSSIKGPLEVKIFAINESISSHKLSKIKNNFKKIHTRSLSILSNSRETIRS